MSIKYGIVLTITMAIWAGDTGWAPQSQKPRVAKPTVEQEISLRLVAAPPTFAELLDTVDLAAYVRILSSEPRSRAIPGGTEWTTVYVAELIELGRNRRFLKSNERIRIVQMGGTFDEPDRILKVVDRKNPPLFAGRPYLLTLRWAEDRDAFMLAYASDSVFEVDRGKIFPRGTSKAVRDFRGKDVRDVVRQIK
jgi:hypothetical protein